jgi:hypothetical protein
MKEVMLKLLEVIDANFCMFSLVVILIFRIVFEAFKS